MTGILHPLLSSKTLAFTIKMRAADKSMQLMKNPIANIAHIWKILIAAMIILQEMSHEDYLEFMMVMVAIQ